MSYCDLNGGQGVAERVEIPRSSPGSTASLPRGRCRPARGRGGSAGDTGLLVSGRSARRAAARRRSTRPSRCPRRRRRRPRPAATSCGSRRRTAPGRRCRFDADPVDAGRRPRDRELRRAAGAPGRRHAPAHRPARRGRCWPCAPRRRAPSPSPRRSACRTRRSATTRSRCPGRGRPGRCPPSCSPPTTARRGARSPTSSRARRSWSTRRSSQRTTQGRFAVVVTDGVRGGFADLPGITVTGEAPTIAITAPTEDKTVVQGNAYLGLEATAFDRDEALGEDAVTWSSDLDGALGSGTRLQVRTGDLSAGEHVLTATATDSQGMTATATRALEVLATEPARAQAGAGGHPDRARGTGHWRHRHERGARRRQRGTGHRARRRARADRRRGREPGGSDHARRMDLRRPRADADLPASADPGRGVHNARGARPRRRDHQRASRSSSPPGR